MQAATGQLRPHRPARLGIGYQGSPWSQVAGSRHEPRSAVVRRGHPARAHSWMILTELGVPAWDRRKLVGPNLIDRGRAGLPRPRSG
jgi:hypothetical protein